MSHSPSVARQLEFGNFLRSRRERLMPAAMGLPGRGRRRTPGLRREEVAYLAGVGTTWYTWLEQGREVHPSTEVLEALATTLRLSHSERQHLFTLANRPFSEAPTSGSEKTPEALIHMLAAMTDQPAYVLGRRWDILAWNQAAVEMFGDFGRLEGDARNLIHMMFLDEHHRSLIADWNDVAPQSLAMFRACSARYTGDPEFERLITLLLRESPEFREWWPRHDVVFQPSTTKRLRHPSAGQLIFEHMVLDVADHPGMRLVVCTLDNSLCKRW